MSIARRRLMRSACSTAWPRRLSVQGANVLHSQRQQARLARFDTWNEKRISRVDQGMQDREGWSLRSDRYREGRQGGDAHSHGSAEQKAMTAEIRRHAYSQQWEAALAAFSTVENPDPLLRTAVMDACVKSFQIEKAQQIFQEMPVKTLAAYNSLIAALGRMRLLREAEDLFAQLRAQELTPDAVTFTSLISGYGMRSRSDMALKAFEEMEASGIPGNPISYSAVMTACSRAGDFEKTSALLDKMRSVSIQPEIRHYVSVVASCAKSNDEERAFAAFQAIRENGLSPNIMAYTIMIKCLSGETAFQKAEELFSQMQSDGIEPDTFVYNALILAAFRSRKLERCFELASEMEKRGCRGNRDTELLFAEINQCTDIIETSASVQGDSNPAVVPQQVTGNLPAGWLQAQDPKSGQPYFWKESDPAGTTTWQRPV